MLSPIREGCGPSFEFETPPSKDALCQVWLKLAKQFLGRIFLNIFNTILHYYLPLEKGVALHLKKLESPSSKDAFAKFGSNWPIGSGEEDF